jgi:hypothetical protein
VVIDRRRQGLQFAPGGERIGYFDRIGITAAAAGSGIVLGGDVVAKLSFSRRAVAFNAACAEGSLAAAGA